MTESALAFLFGLLSALIPVLNVEVYLVGAAALLGDGALSAMAVAAGAGQTLGKIAYYYLGRGALDLAWLRRRGEKKIGTWSRRLQRWQEKAEGRPVWTAALVAVSSFSSIPPFMVVSVFAGMARMPVWAFATVTMATRTARFLILVHAPGAASALLR
ncbi:VTT domain-containing protein [Marinactinospora thermotolerans]|uniref:Membrane protein YqaA, SNARE-associated domain n=1 Tax=Marinactinospora thermotolerans DSM 45154 TaxID=1122192 RepID=A0A1T4SHR5_9ACTN|nr:VTT domain-containing protein [Marinactinospora thermotolerans]SKA27361.1 membrane protein YqaA, SNARE-associated domain [Marinactinospora thermotolerans DSM 45154]